MAKAKGKTTKIDVNNYMRLMLLEKIETAEQMAHQLGMHITGCALNRAKNVVGWEAAGEIDKAVKIARGES